jgi:hypothetical protein
LARSQAHQLAFDESQQSRSEHPRLASYYVFLFRFLMVFQEISALGVNIPTLFGENMHHRDWHCPSSALLFPVYPILCNIMFKAS